VEFCSEVRTTDEFIFINIQNPASEITLTVEVTEKRGVTWGEEIFRRAGLREVAINLDVPRIEDFAGLYNVAYYKRDRYCVAIYYGTLKIEERPWFPGRIDLRGVIKRP